MADRQADDGVRRRRLLQLEGRHALRHCQLLGPLIASFLNTYHYNHWRPETGIRNGDLDGDGRTVKDAAFTHARLGGIHWRYDQVAGNALGRAVGTEVVKTRLRPVHP